MPEAEFAFINWIRQLETARLPSGVGIGDDAAVLPIEGDHDLLVATDMLLDGVHFESANTELHRIGRKALAVNLSDIAAMGGWASAAFISLAVPRDWSQSKLEKIYHGLDGLAQEFKVALAGGDTTSWTDRLAITVTVTGFVKSNHALLRSGARPGDRLFVTGPLGYSQLGSHLDFRPRLKEISLICEQFHPHAAIDISDGLAADLHHVLKASEVNAIVNTNSIPVRSVSKDDDKPTRITHALNDGEDFELLICLHESAAREITKNPLPGVELHEIGWLEAGEIGHPAQCHLEDDRGHRTLLEPGGWSHHFGD